MTERIRLISPVNNSVLIERDCASAAQVQAALDAAALAQQSWRSVPIVERARYCLAAVDAMLAMGEQIAPELAWQMGRPVRYGAGELRGFADRARYMISIAETALAPLQPAPVDGFTRYIKREALGTVLVIAPWNYPYLTAVNAVIPALMAGNSVLLKHASQTLLVGERFAAAFKSAGLPPGLFHNLVLNHAQTAQVIASGQVHQVNFTGSVAGGRTIALAAAPHFLGVGLELGGKDAAYVRADANLAYSAEQLVDGAFFNSGQSCCGIERIYVARSVHDEFVTRCVDLTNAYLLGDPLHQDTTLGPMVNAGAAGFVRTQVAAAVAAGAKTLIDTTRFSANAANSAYCAPQIMVNADHSMALMREENFGPVVGIMAVDSDAQALELINDSAYGLTASIWTADLERAEQLGDAIATGTVFMNRCDYLDPALAWTGVKDTGRGATLSSVGYEHLTRPKSFHLRHAST